MAENTNGKPDKYAERLTQAVEQLRSNVKWTLAAFGAIGTTLLAGSQLSNLGKFDINEPRLWVALACAMAALGAAAFAVRAALKVAYTGDTELSRLDQTDIAYAERESALLEGFGTVEALRAAYYACIATRHQNLVAGAKLAVLQSDKATFLYLDGLVDSVLSYIRYNRIRQEAEKSTKALTAASIVAAIGLVGFAWAANPAKENPTVVLRAPVSEARVTLTEAGKRTLAPVLGAACVAMDRIDVIVLNVTIAGSEVVTLKAKDCPVARITLTDSLGKLLSTPP